MSLISIGISRRSITSNNNSKLQFYVLSKVYDVYLHKNTFVKIYLQGNCNTKVLYNIIHYRLKFKKKNKVMPN